MKQEGWIKLYRQLAKRELWLSEPFTRGQAWVDLLLLANHADGSIRVRGVRVEISRGQVGWSEVKLAERWHWSRGKVRRFIFELKNEQQIEQQTNNQTSIITIVNYAEYQQSDTADETPNDTADGQQTDSRRYTNKKNKKDKKKEKKDPPSPKFTAEDRGMAELHRDLILAVNPSAKTPESLDGWADSYRLMRERDKRDPAKTAAILRWIFTDPGCWSGWKTNILSADKLREKYDKLNMQMGQTPEKPKPLHKTLDITCSCWPRPGMRSEKNAAGQIVAMYCQGCGKMLQKYE